MGAARRAGAAVAADGFYLPQADPILDELTAAPGRPELKAPEIPYYSATLTPRASAGVRRALLGRHGATPCGSLAAVRPALDDGYRVFAEPHPPLTPRGRSGLPAVRHAGCRAGRYSGGAAYCRWGSVAC